MFVVRNSLIIFILRQLLESEEKLLELLWCPLISIHYLIHIYLVVSCSFFFAGAFFNQGLSYSSFQFFYFVIKIGAFILNVLYFYQHFCFTLLGLQCLSHTVGDWTFVKCLVGLYCHFDFIPHPNKEESSLSTIYSNLSNYLVESLRVQFFSDRADTCFSSLSFL